MKKINKLLAVVSIVLGVLALASCGLKDALEGTYDTWYKYNNANGIDIPLGDDTSKDSATVETWQGAEFYVRFNKTDGLTVVVQKEQDVQMTIGGISTTTKGLVGAKKQYSTEDFGSAKWSIMVMTGKFTKCDAPKFVTDTAVFDVSNVLQNGIQWKKVLANYLLNTLLS